MTGEARNEEKKRVFDELLQRDCRKYGQENDRLMEILSPKKTATNAPHKGQKPVSQGQVSILAGLQNNRRQLVLNRERN